MNRPLQMVYGPSSSKKIHYAFFFFFWQHLKLKKRKGHPCDPNKPTAVNTLDNMVLSNKYWYSYLHTRNRIPSSQIRILNHWCMLGSKRMISMVPPHVPKWGIIQFFGGVCDGIRQVNILILSVLSRLYCDIDWLEWGLFDSLSIFSP